MSDPAGLPVEGAGERDRAFGALAVVAGVGLALAIQALAPVGVPLFDGVLVQEPYRYLHPSGDQAGSPASFVSNPTVEGVVSPVFAAATTEGPPQAQLIAQQGAFELTPGATALIVTITPIEPPPVAAPGGEIAGNVYRFAVADQDGTPLPINPCEGCISLLLRAPEGVEEARLMRFADGAWSDVEASHLATTGMYGWNPTALGDFAIVGQPAPDSGLGMDGILLFGGAAVILLLLFTAALLFRVRGPEAPGAVRRGPGRESAGGPHARAIPSKRKGPRRPPSGRHDR